MSGMLAFLGALLSPGDRMSAGELKDLIEKGEKLTIIDCRSDGEYMSGRIPGSLSIPLSKLSGAQIPGQGKVVVYCAAGIRSLKALSIIKDLGLKDAVDLKGGINAWVKEGGKVEK